MAVVVVANVGDVFAEIACCFTSGHWQLLMLTRESALCSAALPGGSRREQDAGGGIVAAVAEVAHRPRNCQPVRSQGREHRVAPLQLGGPSTPYVAFYVSILLRYLHACGTILG